MRSARRSTPSWPGPGWGRAACSSSTGSPASARPPCSATRWSRRPGSWSCGSPARRTRPTCRSPVWPSCCARLRRARPAPGPQARALSVALALQRGRGGRPVRRRARACSASSSRPPTARPVAIVVDDAHLLDRPSAEAVLFMARRLLADPVSRPGRRPLRRGPRLDLGGAAAPEGRRPRRAVELGGRALRGADGADPRADPPHRHPQRGQPPGHRRARPRTGGARPPAGRCPGAGPDRRGGGLRTPVGAAGPGRPHGPRARRRGRR